MDTKVEEEYTVVGLHIGRVKNVSHVLEDNGLVKVVWLKLCFCFLFACQLRSERKERKKNKDG